MGGGTKEIGELSDKQLKNIAAYDNLTEDEKRNIIINTSKYAIPLTIGSGIIGAGLSKNKKGAVIGAALGGGSMAGMAISGHRLHKKQAKAAKKELEYRKKAGFGIVRYDDPN